MSRRTCSRGCRPCFGWSRECGLGDEGLAKPPDSTAGPARKSPCAVHRRSGTRPPPTPPAPPPPPPPQPRGAGLPVDLDRPLDLLLEREGLVPRRPGGIEDRALRAQP